MEKKVQIITDTMQVFGIKPEQMIESWLKKGVLSPAFLHQFTQEADAFEINLEVYAGWYAFEGYRFAPNPDAFPNCQGVVTFVDKSAPKGQRIGVLLPKMQYSTRYHSKNTLLGAKDENDGLANSKLIGVELEGFEVAGIEKENIFSPAIKQLELCGENIEAINSAMLKIGGEPLYDFVWSSTEVNDNYAWAIYFPQNKPIMMQKYNSLSERRMFLL